MITYSANYEFVPTAVSKEGFVVGPHKASLHGVLQRIRSYKISGLCGSCVPVFEQSGLTFLGRDACGKQVSL